MAFISKTIRKITTFLIHVIVQIFLKTCCNFYQTLSILEKNDAVVILEKKVRFAPAWPFDQGKLEPLIVVAGSGVAGVEQVWPLSQFFLLAFSLPDTFDLTFVGEKLVFWSSEWLFWEAEAAHLWPRLVRGFQPRSTRDTFTCCFDSSKKVFLWNSKQRKTVIFCQTWNWARWWRLLRSTGGGGWTLCCDKLTGCPVLVELTAGVLVGALGLVNIWVGCFGLRPRLLTGWPPPERIKTYKSPWISVILFYAQGHANMMQKYIEQVLMNLPCNWG